MDSKIYIKRVYDDPAGTGADGFRVFVDRLWPRGESKEKFHYDLWAKEIAPSTELREWYHADPTNRWDDFRSRYLAEIAANPYTPTLLAQLKQHATITLLFSSHDPIHNNAAVLAEVIGKVKS